MRRPRYTRATRDLLKSIVTEPRTHEGQGMHRLQLAPERIPTALIEMRRLALSMTVPTCPRSSDPRLQTSGRLGGFTGSLSARQLASAHGLPNAVASPGLHLQSLKGWVQG